MNLFTRNAAAPCLLALTFLSAPVWAQSASSVSAASAPSAASHAQKHADYVEKRIADLHSQLKITPAEQPQWDAFAQTMRDNATATDQAFHDRADKLGSQNADDSMKSYAALAQMHADNMQKLASSFSALYATLSPDQKAIADPLFRNEPGHRKHPGAKRKPSAAAPSAASN